MTFSEFLNLTKVIRMLYGVTAASLFFEQNINSYYNLTIEDLTVQVQRDKLATSIKQNA